MKFFVIILNKVFVSAPSKSISNLQLLIFLPQSKTVTFDIFLIIFFHHQSSLEDFSPFICQVFPILIMSLKAAFFHVCGLYYIDQEAPLWAAKAHLYRYCLQFDRADCLKRFIMVTSQQDASIYHSVCMYVCSWHPWAGWILIWPIVSGWVVFQRSKGKKPFITSLAVPWT